MLKLTEKKIADKPVMVQFFKLLPAFDQKDFVVLADRARKISKSQSGHFVSAFNRLKCDLFLRGWNIKDKSHESNYNRDYLGKSFFHSFKPLTGFKCMETNKDS